MHQPIEARTMIRKAHFKIFGDFGDEAAGKG